MKTGDDNQVLRRVLGVVLLLQNKYTSWYSLYGEKILYVAVSSTVQSNIQAMHVYEFLNKYVWAFRDFPTFRFFKRVSPGVFLFQKEREKKKNKYCWDNQNPSFLLFEERGREKAGGRG